MKRRRYKHLTSAKRYIIEIKLIVVPQKHTSICTFDNFKLIFIHLIVHAYSVREKYPSREINLVF